MAFPGIRNVLIISALLSQCQIMVTAQEVPITLPETVVEADSPATADNPSAQANGEPSPQVQAPGNVLDDSSAEGGNQQNASPQAANARAAPSNSFASTSIGAGANSTGLSSPAVSRATNLLNQAESASSGVYGQAELDFRSINRPGDVLEVIPGFIATQHSGTGKANQYFVRGINLDHGTDFALRVDDVPINFCPRMVTVKAISM